MENIKLGTCPHCFAPIWSNQALTKSKYEDTFKCIGCKKLIQYDEIIPF